MLLFLIAFVGTGLIEYILFFQLQRRMKIAELKQICSRPDVVEVLMNACVLHSLVLACMWLFPIFGILEWFIHNYLSNLCSH